ncbi:MAG: YjbH domain-containing protein [Burkholderiales bacterium]|nr:YjbH domain-containing protein [Burkholderiales bacterium]
MAHAQVAPQRLSDWLLAQPPSANAYPLGLSWRVPGEAPAQNALRLGLLNSLSGRDREVTADPAAVDRLREWLHSLPVTGRVPVSVPDARWLQANPARDPMLLPGQSVVLPQRPRTVTVITQEGGRCTVAHAAGLEAMAYLQACSPAGAARTDWVWIAQPDGRVQRFGVAAWNRETQDEPAPGAWIWGPSRGSGWPARFSQKLIAFLATQGPAPDATEDLPAGRQPGGATPPGGASEGLRFSDLAGSDRSRVPPLPNPLPQVRGGEGIINREFPEVSGGEKIPRITNHQSLITNHQSPITNHGRSRSLAVTSSDWGGVGLLQTPTARMRRTGDFSFHLSRTQPYTHGNVFVQPLDWLEAGFRYTSVSNRLYGPTELSGGQSYKDKSFDLKARLWTESAYLPQVAVGIRDLAGTGLFSAEYLVASKRTGALDWSLGLGWGYLAGRSRNVDVGSGGNFSFGTYFTGSTALFGGAQYQTPWERLILKVEYDGNKFQNEPQANNQQLSSPWNFGLVYKAARSVDFTVGVERGNTLMLGLSLHTSLDGLSTPKLNDPPRVPVAATRPLQAPDWSLTSSEIKRQTDWNVRSIGQSGRELRVTIDDAETVYYWRDRVDRVAAVLHRDAPQPVERFTLKYRERGIDVAEHVIDRDAWLEQQTQPVPLSEQREAVIARAAGPAAPETSLYTSKPPRFETGLRLGFQQTLGGPDSFILYQIYAEQQAKLRLRDDTWLQGGLRLGLIDNYDKFKYTAPSNLPRVRTFLREYLTTSNVTVPNLQLTHVGKLSQNQHYSVYGGYLEEMFAGVGAEWLYRPFASRFALGVDVNSVKQRDFSQNFEFRDYRANTGHATLYWDTGWQDVQAKLSAGRYLAGDTGATVELSRTFKNGVAVGAFMTKTNVSGAQFGEGSFDKGVYVSIPFDTILTRSSNTVGYFVWKPLTRDGGAKLWRSVQLFDLTRVRDDRALEFAPAPPPNHATIPSDRREAWVPEASGLAPYTRVMPKPAAAQWETGDMSDQRLIEALYLQEFRNIRTAYDGSRRLTVTLSNDHIRPISRAVGRAARTALRLAPLDTREIRIVFAQRTDPVVTYDFIDLARLDRYFSGAIKSSELAETVAVEYLNPAARQNDPLARLDDVDTDASPAVFANLIPETFTPGRVINDLGNAARTAQDVNWLRAGAIGAGLVWASSGLDRRADRFAKDHETSRWSKAGVKVGDALPWLAFAGAALAAVDSSDPRRSRTGYAATEAGATAVLAVTGLKYAFGRARPETDAGNRSFKPFSTASGHDGFPSGHTAVAWAVATPFAMEYNAPWLYGVAALTNLSRIGSREHWLSDTVAGSLLGYGIGRIFWQSSRSAGKGEPRVWLDPAGVNVSWKY